MMMLAVPVRPDPGFMPTGSLRRRDEDAGRAVGQHDVAHVQPLDALADTRKLGPSTLRSSGCGRRVQRLRESRSTGIGHAVAGSLGAEIASHAAPLPLRMEGCLAATRR